MAGKVQLKSKPVEISDSMEAVYDYIMEKGWGDGLPVIPPTEERISRMIEYSGRKPDEIVEEVAPLHGEATIEKIAINAVMAGCRPEYMPVLIAAVKAMAPPEFNLNGIATTTNPVTPLLIVNGPIRKKINLNCTRGCFGPGWRANATIGRAIRLILCNIGGAIPEAVSKSLHGQPGRYTFCFGEDEENSPWEPLHVERGFKKEASTVTVVGAQATHNVCCLSPDGQTFLKMAANSMSTWGNNDMLLGGSGEPLLVLTSGHAQILAKEGMNKAATKKFLWDNAGAPVSEIPPKAKVTGTEFLVINGKVMPCDRPEDIMIVVAGGPNPYHLVNIPTFGETLAVTREITIPG